MQCLSGHIAIFKQLDCEGTLALYLCSSFHPSTSFYKSNILLRLVFLVAHTWQSHDFFLTTERSTCTHMRCAHLPQFAHFKLGGGSKSSGKSEGGCHSQLFISQGSVLGSFLIFLRPSSVIATTFLKLSTCSIL